MEVKVGEYILLWGGPDANYLSEYRPGKAVHSHRGIVHLPEGLLWGDALRSSTGRVFYVIRPSNADFVLRLRRKTNIFYPKDIGLVLMLTDFHPKARIVEVGSGSGGMAVVLSRLLVEPGKLYSYDVNARHQRVAKENVSKYGRAEKVIWHLRDVAKCGFWEREVDIAIVDVPEPWEIVPHAFRSLKGGGFLVAASPNVEQVKETRKRMNELGFFGIRTVELLLRDWHIREVGCRPDHRMQGHTLFYTFGRKVIRKAAAVK
ncbi:MAG: tRNA (adenine-N1)-methyltransferase [Thermotogae bacterium]|nr:tRNA (adenine-N1)-methyltransferase [Thermotogota bacterium]